MLRLRGRKGDATPVPNKCQPRRDANRLTSAALAPPPSAASTRSPGRRGGRRAATVPGSAARPDATGPNPGSRGPARATAHRPAIAVAPRHSVACFVNRQHCAGTRRVHQVQHARARSGTRGHQRHHSKSGSPGKTCARLPGRARQYRL